METLWNLTLFNKKNYYYNSEINICKIKYVSIVES